MLPGEIVREDGCILEIDRVTDIRQAAAMKDGSRGERYTVKISGHQSYLFSERSTDIAGTHGVMVRLRR